MSGGFPAQRPDTRPKLTLSLEVQGLLGLGNFSHRRRSHCFKEGMAITTVAFVRAYVLGHVIKTFGYLGSFGCGFTCLKLSPPSNGVNLKLRI